MAVGGYKKKSNAPTFKGGFARLENPYCVIRIRHFSIDSNSDSGSNTPTMENLNCSNHWECLGLLGSRHSLVSNRTLEVVGSTPIGSTRAIQQLARPQLNHG